MIRQASPGSTDNCGNLHQLSDTCPRRTKKRTMQAFNRYTSDDTRNQTGVKVGNFGSSGRTYTTHRRLPNDGSDVLSHATTYGGCGSVGFIALLILSSGVMFWKERALSQTMQVLAEVASEAKALSSPDAKPENSGMLVSVVAVPSVTDGLLEDEYFGQKFGTALEMQRVPEYCQWEEYRHVKRTVVGKEPNTCAAKASSNCDVNCASRSLDSCVSPRDRDREGEPAACCRVVSGADIVREDVTYTYHKGWRRSRVNSLAFDNAVSYHNPQRDPAPPLHALSQADVDLKSSNPLFSSPTNRLLRVKPEGLQSVLGPWQTVRIGGGSGSGSGGTNSGVSARAPNDGFREFDNTYFYSRLQYDGAESGAWAVAKVAASYLLEGVVDASSAARAVGLESLMDKAGLGWIAKGTCSAGDVRVHLEKRELPALPLTLVGSQNTDGILVPHAFRNGQQRLFVRRGSLTPKELVEAEGGEELRAAWWWRGLAFVLAGWAFFAGGSSTSLLLWRSGCQSEDQGSGLALLVRVFIEAVGFCAAFTAMAWSHFYGAASALKPFAVAALVAAFAAMAGGEAGKIDRKYE